MLNCVLNRYTRTTALFASSVADHGTVHDRTYASSIQ